MFRLLAHNTGSSLRPVILRNVRTNPSLKLTGTNNASIDLEKNFQFRNNSSAASAGPATITPQHQTKADHLFLKSADPILPVSKGDSGITRKKVQRFEQLLHGSVGKTIKNRNLQLDKQLSNVRVLSELFHDDALKSNLSADNVYNYAGLLSEAIYNNRLNRLNDSRNRDSDLYQNLTLSNDIWLKNAILELAENLSTGPLRNLVSHQILRKLFFAMLQLQVNTEMIKFWEHGVNDPKHSSMYLKHTVLSVILPLTYSEKRFLYDQIIKLYEVNTKNLPYVAHHLSAAIGKVAIKEGDYLRALDCLELILAYLESGREKPTTIHRTLAELHAAFIGDCKDIKIARHFFNKTIENLLPYKVVLKAPHVQKLLEHCMEANEPYETILDFWKQTLTTYVNEPLASFNARYSIVNKAFFSVFFQMYPTLTEEGYTKLKEVISTYASIKPVDDFFLNNIITNCTWNDKVVFQQLVENYDVYDVTKTPVLYRVTLKKMGEIKEFSNSEILEQWNATLRFLDDAGYKYIPIADWASLREATILSPYSDSRSEFYLAVLHAYRNYHQDEKAVHRFVKYWISKPQKLAIARVSRESTPSFETDVEVTIPQFKNLRENVNYDSVASNLIVFSREENDAKSGAYN